MDWRQKFTPIERRLIELSKYDKPETITFASKYELYATYMKEDNTPESYPVYMESFTMNPKADGKIFWAWVRCEQNNASIAVYPTNCIKKLRKTQLLDKKSVFVVGHDYFDRK
jgi:hypothetical protein